MDPSRLETDSWGQSPSEITVVPRAHTKRARGTPPARGWTPIAFTIRHYYEQRSRREPCPRSVSPSSDTAPGAVIVVPDLIDIEQTSRSRGVISPESPEPGYIVVSFTVLVLKPIPAPSTQFILES